MAKPTSGSQKVAGYVTKIGKQSQKTVHGESEDKKSLVDQESKTEL